MAIERPAVQQATYEVLASEYYDPFKHPTCANFRHGSSLLLDGWFDTWCSPICEAGSGRSAVCELFEEHGRRPGQLTLIDSSSSMLAHSAKWRTMDNATHVIADACGLPLRRNSIGTLVASLGDAFNVEQFWREANRVLQTEGRAYFTTPSHDWAVAYRAVEWQGGMDEAIFTLVNGQTVAVPSIILPLDHQRDLVRSCGFSVEDSRQIRVSELRDQHISQKLLVGSQTSDPVVVTGYELRKVREA